MKKRITIISLAIIAVSLTAYSTINYKDINECNKVVAEKNNTAEEKIKSRIFTDFIYEIGPRFTPIKKSDLHKLTSFSDYIGNEHAQRIINYKSLSVMLVVNDRPSDDRITNTDNNFNKEQLHFLKSLDYSTNLMMWADYEEVSEETGEIQDAHWTPYLTVVPETQAQYSDGIKALKIFLKEATEDTRVKANVDPEKLQPAKLYFTVTKNGAIENVKLDRTSNYPQVDDKMIQLIKEAPGYWTPARNTKGDKVDQELVVSFGLMGC
ncbi:hypothetical protein [Pontimicrobium sp. IMCC45349]|uniref:hypothetical protein n=1 Tax=Pontimicrobium sp. IMCC45349 TaxID=3391574 RepID=UPI0039A2D56D